MITETELKKIFIFQDFLAEDLARILPNLTEKTYPPNETIIYRGDPGYSMFFILDGNVIVTLINDEGFEYTIGNLGPGDNFGEMALLSGEPRSANVKAVGEVRVAELFQESFLELISIYPKLADSFFRQIAQRRAKSMVREQFSNLERSEIIANILAQKPPALDNFQGKTKWVSDLNASICKLALTENNVLILGERGTGKDLAARLIHFKSSVGSKPLFSLDCANPPPVQRESGPTRAGTKDELLLEIAQEAALFGHGANAGSYARGIRKGYLELAEGGALVLANIESLSPYVQSLLVSYLKEGFFVRTGESRKIATKMRLISTSTRTLEELKNLPSLDPELLTLVNGELLKMKPLRERKKDIPIIAEHLVSEYNAKFGKKVTGFSKEALNSLVDHDWPLNIDEMQQVLERATAISEEEVITERQVFLNMPTFSTTGKFNLLSIPFLRKVANYEFFPASLRLVTTPFILALTILTFVGPPQNNPANLIVWAVWWPFLIFSILISARSWCGYCPLPLIADGMNFYRKNFIAVPKFLSKHGLWVGIAGFVLVLLTEHATHMFTTARATSVLLLTILFGAVATNALFGRRSWCKHVCPLGRMIASSSSISMLELGSNSNVCSSQCHTHDCIREGNCPMGLHPSAAGTSKDCILCLSCLKKCKHQSVRVDVRFPWYEFLVKEKWNVTEGYFAVILTALVLAVKLPSTRLFSQWMDQQVWIDRTLLDVLLSLSTGALFILAVVVASGFFSGESWKKNFAISGFTYIFLAFAGFLNIYLHEFVYSGHHLLPWIVEMVGLQSLVPAEWITPNLGTLKAIIPLITLLGLTTSILLFSVLSKKNSMPLMVSRAQQGIMLVTALVFLLIL